MIRKHFRALHGLMAAGAMLLAGAVQAGDARIADRVIHTQAAGIDIYVYPMDVKNVVSMRGYMPLGTAPIDARKTNPVLPEVTAAMLSNGTTKRSKFQISEMLSSKGAELNMGADDRAMSFASRNLRADTGMVIDLLAEQLRSPAFAPDELAKTKLELQAQIQSMGDDADSLASEAMKLAWYPMSHPSATVPRAQLGALVDKVTVADMRAFHQKNYGPEHMVLVFAGDVDARQIEQLVGKAFAGWKGGLPLVREAGETLTPSALAQDIPLADKAAVSVQWKRPIGLMTTDPDMLPLELGMSALGDGFTSRLQGTVRDKEGLTYGISANVGGGDLYGGSFEIGTSFAPELLDKGIASTRRELDKWYQGGITAQELANRKTAVVGRQRLTMGSTQGMVYVLAQTLMRGEPLSAIDTFADRVNAVTLDQVNAAIRKYGDPSKLMMVRAGTFPKK